jgi:hypothetical protein
MDTPMETRRQLLRLVLRLGIFLGLTMLSGSGFARSAWDDIRADLFGARPIEAGQGVISLKAPYRALDQRFDLDRGGVDRWAPN